MPSINGVQLCAEIRKNKNTPFILYTGKGSEEVCSIAFSVGVDDYIRKESELSHYQVIAKRIRHAVEKRRAEEKLAQQALMLSEANDAIIGYDNEYRVTFWNREAERLYGYSEDEAMGKLGYDLLKPTYIGVTREDFTKRAKDTGRSESESIRVAKDGRRVNVEAHVILLRSSDGESIGYASIDRDITERKRAEEQPRENEERLKASNEGLTALNEEIQAAEGELRTSNDELQSLNKALNSMNEELGTSREELQRYSASLEDTVAERTGEINEAKDRLEATAIYTRSLIEASLDPLVTINSKGLITHVNEATIQATGVPREKLIGSDFSDYFTDPEKARIGYTQVFFEGFVKDYPLTIRHTSGKVTDVLYNASVYRDEGGKIEGVFAAARDVAEKNLLVEQLRRAEVIGAVEQMGATVAHDLRGPLGLIVQSVNMIKQNPSLMPSMLQLVEENAVRSLKMIADWRSSTREVMPQPVKTNLGDLIKNVLEGLPIPGNVEVNTSFGEDLDSVSVDPEIMHRVIDNLVKNAVEAMPSGGKLSIKSEKEGDSFVISVNDTGVGIPEGLKERIFSPLYTSKAGGMGLGLTYSKRAVEVMGGYIDFNSFVGVGTTFTVKLPAPRARVVRSVKM
jgi:PAS domain S-box-containing protein